MPADLLSRPPPCPECGHPTRLRERQLEGWHDYECTSCDWWEAYRKPLTLATAPWTAPVLAAVVEVVDQHIAALEAGIADHRAKTARDESNSVREKKRAQVRELRRLRAALTGGPDVRAR